MVEARDADALEGDDLEAVAAARAEEALSRFLPSDEHGATRTHHVTAVVLAHEGAEWLPRTLAGLGEQVRAPDRVLGVVAGSADGSADLLAQSLSEWLDVDATGGMAHALGVATGVGPSRRDAEPAGDDGVDTEPIRWLWIVHDDSAPQPSCLSALLEGADRHPQAHVIVPKTVAWLDSGRLVGIGNRWSPGVPVVEHLEPGEVDQGQHDTDRAVYTGSSAGMLVRADTWDALGGMDAQYGEAGAAADLCRRVWGAGAEVWFVPGAVLAHRRAGSRGIRGGLPARPDPRREARHAQLLLELTQAPTLARPWRWLRGWLSTFVRAIALLLTREPEEAAAELHGAWDALAHPRAVRAGRRSFRRPPAVSTARPKRVRARRGTSLVGSFEAWSAASRRARGTAARPRPTGRLWLPLSIAGALAVAALVREPGMLIGSGTLRGGGLLPAPGAGELMSQYLASWQDTRFGLPTAQPAYLPLLAAGSLPLLGSVDLLLRLAFGLAVPLAFLSAYVALGPTFAGRQRIPLALAWSLLPAGAAAMSGGRISTLAVLLLGPLTARLIARALGRARNPAVGIRPAIAAGTLLGVTVAFAPLVYLLVLVGALLAWLFVGAPRWPLRTGLVILVVPAFFLALWAPRLWTAPWLALSDLGRNDVSMGSPEPWPWGLSPGGPSSVAWAGAPLLAVAILAVLLIGRTLRLLAGAAAALALLAAVAWLPVGVARLWPRVDATTLWPGQELLVAGGILVVLLGSLAQRGGPGRRVVELAWLGCIAVLAVGWWITPSGMTVGTDSGLPPVVGLAEQSPDRSRALVLAPEGDEVRYAVSTGPVTALGAADALAAPQDDPAFTTDVQALVSGAAGDVEDILGGRGIRYVVLDGPTGDPLVAELDAVIGLRRLASSEEQTLWLVAGEPVRAELVSPDADTESVVVPVTTTPTSVDVVLHPRIAVPRALVVNERYDAGWQAVLAGADLGLAPDADGMLSAPVDRAGSLVVRHVGVWPYLAIAQLALMAALAVLSLPKRRPLDIDDLDAAADAPAPDSEEAEGELSAVEESIERAADPEAAG